MDLGVLEHQLAQNTPASYIVRVMRLIEVTRRAAGTRSTSLRTHLASARR